MSDTIPPEETAQNTISRVVNSQDNERLRSMCSLLNTFNYAVQIQAGRNQWEPKDFRLFAISLCAMDQIGLDEKPHTEKTLLRSVETAMQNDMAGMRK